MPGGIKEVYADALQAARRYPDDRYPEFRGAAAGYVDYAVDDVILTPGGLAAIQLAIEATVTAGDSVLTPYPSFGEYAREAHLQGADPIFIPAPDLLDTDPRALVVSLQSKQQTTQLAGLTRTTSSSRSWPDVAKRGPRYSSMGVLESTDRPSLAGTSGIHTLAHETLWASSRFAVASGSLRDLIAAGRRIC